MENLSIIIGIVTLVFNFLQIILFFKLWRMTNDTRAIRNTLSPTSKYFIIKEIQKKNPNISNLLFDALYSEFENNYLSGIGGYKEIVDKYESLYEMAGLKVPDVFTNIESDYQFHDVFRNL